MELLVPDVSGIVFSKYVILHLKYRLFSPYIQRLVPFNCKKLLYYDYAALSPGLSILLSLSREMRLMITLEREAAVGATRVTDLYEFLSQCDVVTVNCPLHEGTRGLISAEAIAHMKDGAWLVNTARGAICDAGAVRNAVTSNKLLGSIFLSFFLSGSTVNV